MTRTMLTPATGENLAVVGDIVTPLVEGDRFTVFEVVGPEMSGPPPHEHPWDEAYYILEGEVAVRTADGECIARPGGRFLVPAGATHSFEIKSKVARFLVTTDGPGAARFFRDMDANVPAGPITDEALPRIIEVAKRNGLTSPLF